MYEKHIVGTDTKKIAETIYYQFEVGQFCSIPEHLGNAVLIYLNELDLKENTTVLATTGRRIRKLVKTKDMIGGYLVHKAFKWNLLKGTYNIWRIQ